MIFLDTNVMSETLKKAPDSAVIAWLVRHDTELALPTVAVAEIAFGIQKIRRSARRSPGRGTCELASPVLRQDVCLHGRSSIGLWRYHGRRCAAGEGGVGSGRHDRGDSADQWWPVGDPKPQRFRDNRARIDLALAILTVRPDPTTIGPLARFCV